MLEELKASGQLKIVKEEKPEKESMPKGLKQDESGRMIDDEGNVINIKVRRKGDNDERIIE